MLQAINMAELNDKSENLPTPVLKSGRFGVPWTEWRTPNLLNIVKWMATSPNNSSIPSDEKLDKELPILKPGFNNSANEDAIHVTWLGHATVVVQMDNTTFITDPMFSDRASPSQMFGSKRFRKAPCKIEELPKIDFVLISHNHYDHLDYNSVRKLIERFGNEITWFVPEGLKKWMTDTGCENVHELNWWAKYNFTPNIKIVATPAQHWSKRTLNDDNKSLWSSWCVLGRDNKFFFAGDTGYPKEAPVFKKIGEKFGPFDLAAIPIGAYDPRWFMHDQHVDPVEAVQIHLDVQAKYSVGVHWGTFALANEHYLAPREELHAALKEQNIDENIFFTLNHGESRVIKKTI